MPRPPPPCRLDEFVSCGFTHKSHTNRKLSTWLNAEHRDLNGLSALCWASAAGINYPHATRHWLADCVIDWLIEGRIDRPVSGAEPSRVEQETQRHLAGKEKDIYCKNLTCCSNALIYNTSIYYFCPFGKHLHCQDVPMILLGHQVHSRLHYCPSVVLTTLLRGREGGKKRT